ncbi:DUF2798 domain-containing protein [Rossellomorea marisflavi]|uniref:DUF2798 domain-containing protein n=1 Tax=Rossellomorea marisflavi TaxID=189381 RepID=UPI003514E8D9
MKIHSKYRRVITAFVTALCMSIFISFMLVSINFGYDSHFLLTWLRMWSEAFACAFFGAYFFPKFIQYLISKSHFFENTID